MKTLKTITAIVITMITLFTSINTFAGIVTNTKGWTYIKTNADYTDTSTYKEVSREIFSTKYVGYIRLWDNSTMTGSFKDVYDTILKVDYLFKSSNNIKSFYIPSGGLTETATAKLYNKFYTRCINENGSIKIDIYNEVQYPFFFEGYESSSYGLYAYDQQTINYVTVDSTGHNQIVWNSTENVGISTYNIYKLNNASSYEKIGTIPYSTGELSYTDNSSNPTVKSDIYKISITDTNSLESDLSVAHKTMHISISISPEGYRNIDFSDKYEGFNYNSFFILRSNSDSLNFQIVDTLSSLFSSYTDTELKQSKGELPIYYYKVGVIKSSKSKGEKGVLPVEFKGVASSFSNSVTNKDLNTSVGVVMNGYNKIEVKVYPNPVVNELNINLSNVEKIQILNISGAIVLESNMNKVDVSELCNGIYFVKANDGQQVYNAKFVKN